VNRFSEAVRATLSPASHREPSHNRKTRQPNASRVTSLLQQVLTRPPRAFTLFSQARRPRNRTTQTPILRRCLWPPRPPSRHPVITRLERTT